MAILLFAKGDGLTKDIYENGRKEVNRSSHPLGQCDLKKQGGEAH